MEKSLLKLITQRVSTPAKQLAEPAPNRVQLKQIIQAAMSVPDHGALVPYRFIVIEKQAREELSKLFIKALKIRQPNASEAKISKQGAKPLRSPMIIVCVASPNEKANIPLVEQKACANASVMQMMLAANAIGFDNIWLTGDFCYDSMVKEGLGIALHEEIMGFVYIGTATKEQKVITRPNADDVISYWEKIQTYHSDY